MNLRQSSKAKPLLSVVFVALFGTILTSQTPVVPEPEVTVYKTPT
jgi:hypothetical protein